jgi:hypothetical protein
MHYLGNNDTQKSLYMFSTGAIFFKYFESEVEPVYSCFWFEECKDCKKLRNVSHRSFPEQGIPGRY